MKSAAYFEARSQRVGDCRLWILSLDVSGYGKCKDGGCMTGAHRVAYVTFIGPIPKDAHVLHTCDIPRCVNPEHLWLGTNLDNIADRTRKGRSARGLTHWGVKLIPEHVREIRASNETQLVLAKRYGVGTSTIGDIKRGRLWAHLGEVEVA